jgi:hypothetical protein
MRYKLVHSKRRSATGVPPQGGSRAANFFEEIVYSHVADRKGQYLVFVIRIRYSHTGFIIIGSFIQHV